MGIEQDLLNIMSVATISIAMGVFLGLTAWSLLFAVIGFVERLVFRVACRKTGDVVSQGFRETSKILNGTTTETVSKQKDAPH